MGCPPTRPRPRKEPGLSGTKTVIPNLLLTALASSRPLTETEREKCKDCAGATHPGNGPALTQAATKTARTHADAPTSAPPPQAPPAPGHRSKRNGLPFKPNGSGTSGALNPFDWWQQYQPPMGLCSADFVPFPPCSPLPAPKSSLRQAQNQGKVSIRKHCL